ncbi:GAF domain-containing protein [Nocardia carnea]|uniref:GAF domain-containing protein n=1 Tax=Nocardia carnea TaxID=37328 RepID=UPI0012DF48ED|nr:GAF domain-containing protein [Nocardia carnea]
MTESAQDSGVGESAQPVRSPHTSAVRPWVLVEALGSKGEERRVVAEGLHPRRYTRLTRTRIAGSRAIAEHLPAVVDAAVDSGEPQVKVAYPPSGAHIRITAVPVIGPDGSVLAVQVWAGPRAQVAPERPAVGTLLWQTPGTGIALTSSVAEQLLDTGISVSAERALPDLIRHLEGLDNRADLLRLFDSGSPPALYAGFAVTTGESSQTRRTLYITARSRGSGSQRRASALIADVSLTRPAPAPAFTMRLIDAMPTPADHAIGVMDVRTGLVHDWVRRGRAPLDRWMNEIPHVHPHDLNELSIVRAALLDGVGSARGSWRLRFDEKSPWTRVHAQWRVLAWDPSPQALLELHALDLHVPDPSPRQVLHPPNARL